MSRFKVRVLAGALRKPRIEGFEAFVVLDRQNDHEAFTDLGDLSLGTSGRNNRPRRFQTDSSLMWNSLRSFSKIETEKKGTLFESLNSSRLRQNGYPHLNGKKTAYLESLTILK